MKRVPLSWLAGVALAIAAAGPAAAEDLVLFGAGSLREAMTQIAREFQARTGVAVRTEFGPSGVMRERIEKGERVDVFTSADMGHPLRLERQGHDSARNIFRLRRRLTRVSFPAMPATAKRNSRMVTQRQ